MVCKQLPLLHPQPFLATAGHGKTLLTDSKKRILFSQGHVADAGSRDCDTQAGSLCGRRLSPA